MIDLPIRPIANFPLDMGHHFVCTYVGALGRWNSLETLLESAQILEGSRVRFLIIGDGDHRDALRKHAETLGLTNVVFHGPVPKKQVLDMAASRVCVLCTWPHPFLGTVPPEQDLRLYGGGPAGRGRCSRRTCCPDRNRRLWMGRYPGST